MLTRRKRQKEMARCVALTAPGPHALLLVVPLGRYTVEDHKATQKILSMFGKTALSFMIFLLTGKDDLEDTDIHEYLKSAPEDIQKLICKFEDCYCLFNNKASGTEQEDQRTQLLTLVQCMVMENGGSCFTNKMYGSAEKGIQKQTREKQEHYREELERERARLREKVTQEPLDDDCKMFPFILLWILNNNLHLQLLYTAAQFLDNSLLCFIRSSILCMSNASDLLACGPDSWNSTEHF